MVGNKRDLLGIVESRWSLAILILGALTALGGGVIGFLFSEASIWMETFKPLSSYIAGLVGAATIVLVLLGAALFRIWWVKASLDSKFSERSTLNPTKRNFEDERIFLTDIANPVHGRISKKTFTNCEIMGPANLTLVGPGTAIDCGFLNCDFLAIKENSHINNVIVIEECTFRDCQFFRCSILAVADEFNHIFPGLRKSGLQVISANYP